MNEPTKPNDAKPSGARIAVVYFNRSINLCGDERDSASLPMAGQAHQPGNVCDDIVLVSALTDGTFDRTGKPANGLLFTKRRHDTRLNKTVQARTFVPLGDIRSVTYSTGE